MARKKKYDYFSSFKDQAGIALQEARFLKEIIEDYDNAGSFAKIMAKAHGVENEGDELNHRNYEAIAVDFITPFDRDDIIDISSSLDDIIDQLESTIRLFYMMDVHVVHPRCGDLVDCLISSLKALRIALDEFPDFKKSKKFRKSVHDVNDYEEQADNVYMETMRHLYTEEADDPIHVMKWSRIFDKLESCCDACEHVCDVMETILLKNS